MKGASGLLKIINEFSIFVAKVKHYIYEPRNMDQSQKYINDRILKS